MEKTQKQSICTPMLCPKGSLTNCKRDFGAAIKEDENGKYISFSTGGRHPYAPCFYDMETRIKDMDKGRIAKQGISISPRLFYYEFPIETATEVATICNDEIQKLLRNTATAFMLLAQSLYKILKLLLRS